MILMPNMDITSYAAVRSHLWPGMIAFFCPDTSGLRKLTPSGFVSWRIQRCQKPAHECAHAGLLDRVRDRIVLIHATPPRCIAAPFSAYLGPTEAPDGKHLAPYPGKVYVAQFGKCDGERAASQAWENLLLPYDYLDILAHRLGMPRRNTQRYICSEHVAECLMAGGALLHPPENGWGWTPADLALDPRCPALWRLR